MAIIKPGHQISFGFSFSFPSHTTDVETSTSQPAKDFGFDPEAPGLAKAGEMPPSILGWATNNN